MRLYLVRHGESIGNARGFHQNATTPLSEIGLDQARFVAHRFSKIPVDLILASDYVRTQETAKEIGKKIGKPIVTERLLREIKRPQEVEGHVYEDLSTKHIYKLIDQHKYDPTWHYSDEENYFDVYKRAQQFLDSVTKLNVSTCLAVTHGIFLRMCLMVIFYPKELQVDFLERSFSVFHTTNTGITVFEHDQGSWRLLTFNDYAHLA